MRPSFISAAKGGRIHSSASPASTVVHVRVEMDQLFAVPDESDRVARAVDEGLVVAELLHFGDDRTCDAALLVRVAAYAHELAREFDYIFLKSVRQRHKPALPA